MEIEIPRGLVYGNTLAGLVIYHLVLAVDKESNFYTEDVLFVDPKGILSLGFPDRVKGISDFYNRLTKKELFLLSEHQFSDFKEFYQSRNDNDFFQSNLYSFYPKTSELIRKTSLLEKVSNQ